MSEQLEPVLHRRRVYICTLQGPGHPASGLTISTLQPTGPVLLLDISRLTEPVLLLDVSAVHWACVDVSTPRGPELHLDTQGKEKSVWTWLFEELDASYRRLDSGGINI